MPCLIKFVKNTMKMEYKETWMASKNLSLLGWIHAGSNSSVNAARI